MVWACGAYEWRAFDKKEFIGQKWRVKEAGADHRSGGRTGSGEHVRKGMWGWRKRGGFVWIGGFGE